MAVTFFGVQYEDKKEIAGLISKASEGAHISSRSYNIEGQPAPVNGELVFRALVDAEISGRDIAKILGVKHGMAIRYAKSLNLTFKGDSNYKAKIAAKKAVEASNARRLAKERKATRVSKTSPPGRAKKPANYAVLQGQSADFDPSAGDADNAAKAKVRLEQIEKKLTAITIPDGATTLVEVKEGHCDGNLGILHPETGEMLYCNRPVPDGRVDRNGKTLCPDHRVKSKAATAECV